MCVCVCVACVNSKEREVWGARKREKEERCGLWECLYFILFCVRACMFPTARKENHSKKKIEIKKKKMYEKKKQNRLFVKLFF